MRLLLAVLLLAAALGPSARALVPDQKLAGFARQIGIVDLDGFVETIQSLDRTGRLPPRYLTKQQAERLGWSPGRDLWKYAPGKSIGGDRFGNRERRVPASPGTALHEADLDYAGGQRGPKRLVYGADGRRWVTTDHYETFREVPK
jgi:hypothetical protein